MNIKIIEILIALTISSFTEINPVVAFGTVDFIYLFIKAIEFLYLNSKKKTHQTLGRTMMGPALIRAVHQFL